MTRQLISTNKQPLLRSPHAKRPPQSGFVQVGLSDKFVLVQSYSFRLKSSHASAAQIVTDATVNHHGPQRIGIKTKIKNNSHQPPERFCEGDGATSAVFSEGSIVPSPLSSANLISPREASQLLISREPEKSPVPKSTSAVTASGIDATIKAR
jgi:hypothetical protein